MFSSNNTSNSEFNDKQSYKELEHFLYAVAYSKGKVRKKEVDAQREFVLTELAPYIAK